MLTEQELKEIIKRGDETIRKIIESEKTKEFKLILDTNLNTNVLNNGIVIKDDYKLDIDGYVVIPFRAIVRQHS